MSEGTVKIIIALCLLGAFLSWVFSRTFIYDALFLILAMVWMMVLFIKTSKSREP